MKKNYREYAAVMLVIIVVAAALIFEFVRITYTEDKTANALLKGTVPRLIMGVLLTAIFILLDGKRYFTQRSGIRQLVWCIPCLFVALANFPYSALIGGAATVERADLIWLFIIKCLAIAVMEEVLFRGLIQKYLYDFFGQKKYGALLTAAVTAIIFALFHLINLFNGANIGSTLLQVGYSFLIGAMLSAVIIRTENIYICIAIHCLFDIGGLIIPDLGTGAFQDAVFWALTAVAGIICFAHILYFLMKTKPPQ